MKTKLISFVAVIASSISASAASTDELPKALAFARYDGMMNKSPFAVATAAVQAPPAPNVFKDLYIANAARLTDESVVTLNSSTDKNFREYLSTKSPNKSGYSITNIEWSDHVGQTKVTISKDGQVGTLTFNQALITAAPANMPIQMPQPIINAPQPLNTMPSGTVPPVPQYNQPVNNTNTIKPAPIPTLPTPPQRVRSVIQRNPGPAATENGIRTDDN